MPKFVLIDPSIADIGGHHYEYAVRVLEAAEQAGFEPVLAVNRRFNKRRTPVPWPVYPTYELGFWGEKKAKRKFSLRGRIDWRDLARRYMSAQTRRRLRLRFVPLLAKMVLVAYAVRQTIRPDYWWARAKIRFTFSPLGLLWAVRRAPFNFLQRSLISGRFSWTKLMLMAVALMVLAIPTACLLIVRKVAQRVFRPSKRRRKLVIKVRRRVRGLWGRVKRGRALVGFVRQMLAFNRDTKRLFHSCKTSTEDLVFIPTIGFSEMLGLGQYLNKAAKLPQMTWHLLFRRNIYTGREQGYTRQDESQREVRNAFDYFLRNASSQTIKFYTDTEQLTAQYSRLGLKDVATLPIPVPAEIRHQGQRGSKPSHPFVIAYAGDARTEKGYHYLPRLVRDLSWGHRDDVQFKFQSNYNMSKGEPKAVAAREALEAMDPKRITLLRRPLTSLEYCDLVTGADILLIPYNALNYYARSSGILAEALAAGIPVVVPTASWMSAQFAEAVWNYHADLLQQGRRLETTSLLQLLEQQMRASSLRWHSRLRVVVPREATMGVVTFQPQAAHRGEVLALDVEFRDMDGTSLGRETLCPTQAAERGSAAMEIPCGTSELLVTMRRPRSEPAPRVKSKSVAKQTDPFVGSPLLLYRDLTLNFVHLNERVPRSVVGTTFDTPASISQAVREILDHYVAYRTSALQLSRAFGRFHSPEGLVEKLAENAHRAQVVHHDFKALAATEEPAFVFDDYGKARR